MNQEFVDLARNFSYESIQDGHEPVLPYRLFRPWVEEGRQYPLVVYIHGVGECGNNNESPLTNLIGGTVFSTPEHQQKRPCFIFVPQLPNVDDIGGVMWNMGRIKGEIERVIANNPIDRRRIYITGISMGAIATYHMISAYSELFTAAIPICGAATIGELQNIHNVAIWAFHACDDARVPARGDFWQAGMQFLGSKSIVDYLRENGRDNIHYTEYPANFIQQKYQREAHSCWEEVYRDEGVFDWLFSQYS